jgi:glutathione S-transferase
MHTTRPILYSFRRCPYAMRARMAIVYSQQSVELREVILKHKPNSLLSCSAKGTVPVLVLPNTPAIDESLDIMLWALSINDPDDWQSNLVEQKRLIEENDGSFKSNLDKYKYADRYPEQSELFYRESCYRFLNELEERLSGHRFLFSDQYSLADIAIFPFIRQFAHVDLAWFISHKWHEVSRWLTELKSSELFTGIMQKYPAWSEGDIPRFFPSNKLTLAKI